MIKFLEPIAQAREEAGFKTGPYDHYPLWPEARKQCPSFCDREYDEVPRGRVVYNIHADKFSVYGNAETLKQYGGKIRAEFGLPTGKTHFVPDVHYTLKRT